ncbi:MAG: hypothetical protein Q9176_004452 [Flavoplaca citrina]
MSGRRPRKSPPKPSSRGTQGSSPSSSRNTAPNQPQFRPWVFTQPAAAQQGSDSRSQAQRANRTIAETTMNNFQDAELQGILRDRYHNVPQNRRPSMDEVRNRVATLFGIVGPRGQPAREAVRFLAEAGWNPTTALRRFINITRPQIPRAVASVRDGPLKEPEVDFKDDSDDDKPIPEGVDVIEIKDDRGTDKAVFHHQIRRYLIERDQRRYGNYRYELRKGKKPEDPEDQTAPHPKWLGWGFDKEKPMPPILFRYKRAGHQDPDYDIGDTMWWRGHAVVDIDKYRLRDIRDIPSTLASNVEGGLLEAIERTDSRIRHQDLSARLYDPKIPEMPIPKELKNRDNKLSQSMRRFREKRGIIAWNSPKSGGDRYSKWMDDNLPDFMKAHNSTEGFGPLSKETIGEIKKKPTKDPNRREKYLAEHKARLDRVRSMDKEGKITKHVSETKLETKPKTESRASNKGPDSRHAIPQNVEEEAALREAMLPSIQHFIELTNDLPTIAHWQASYWMILAEIDRQLRAFFKQQDLEPVHLIGHGFWTGGILNYENARLEQTPLMTALKEIEEAEERAAQAQEEEDSGDVEMEEEAEQSGSTDDEDQAAHSGQSDM